MYHNDRKEESAFDLSEILTRILKYSIEGFVVSVVAFMLPGRTMDLYQVIIIGLTAAAMFSLLDLFSPSIASAARFGVGAGAGFNMVTFPAGAPVPVVA